MTSAPTTATSPAPLARLFGRDREAHPYGLADLDEPFWAGSTWWLDGDAAVGRITLPGADEPIVYSVSARAPEATLDLLAAVVDELPPHLVITGPVGLSARLAPWYRARWSKTQQKMHLAQPAALPPADPRVHDIVRSDVEEVERLFELVHEVGAFFTPDLLDRGHYVGIRESDALVAIAGVHVMSERYGVAAVANVGTHPDHRRRGLAIAAVATLCHRLLRLVPTIGLNVATTNNGGRRLYEGIGFEPVLVYEEAELQIRG